MYTETEREQAAVAEEAQPHETQPCAVCGALPPDQGEGVMGAVEPPGGWCGEPVPICDDCASSDEAAYQHAVAVGKDRFWVGPKTITACAGATWRDWDTGDKVAAMLPVEGTWWHGAQYGEVTVAGRGPGNTKGWVEVVHTDGSTRKYRPVALVAKSDPYEED